jgi:hypothetical protein
MAGQVEEVTELADDPAAPFDRIVGPMTVGESSGVDAAEDRARRARRQSLRELLDER